jgi:DNA polymerase I
MSESNLLILVDGSSFLFRAYHAMPALSNAAGEPTGAIYGVVNMLRRLRNDYPTQRAAIVFDAKGRTFRDDMYAEYKATRAPTPPDLEVQIEPLLEIIRALGFPVIVVPGVEADDVIGTLVHQARASGLRTLISTNDKDMAQLVDDETHIVNTMDGSVLDPEGVVKKFGVGPRRIVDYLTLVGDSVDNVPGVPKVGPKTAARWLQEFGSLDELVARADAVKGKVGESLRSSLDHLPLSRRLVTIKTDLALDESVEDLVMQPPDRAALKALYARFEFKTWLAELLARDGEASALSSDGEDGLRGRGAYELVLDRPGLDRWLERLAEAGQFAFDTETTSLDYMEAEIVGVSFSVEPGRAAYVPCGHDYENAPVQLSRATVLEALRPLLESETAKKVCHNLKYDMSVLANYGIEIRGGEYDTMLESYVLDSTATRHDMDSLALKYLKYNEIELPLMPVLSRMERTGVALDPERLHAQSRELAERIRELEARPSSWPGASSTSARPSSSARSSSRNRRSR